MKMIFSNPPSFDGTPKELASFVTALSNLQRMQEDKEIETSVNLLFQTLLNSAPKGGEGDAEPR